MALFRRRTGPTSAEPEPAPELFDEAFQRKLESMVLLSRKLQHGTRRGERRTKQTGAGIEFADHRAYYPGDDLRRLDVNVYQRHDKLLIRLSEELPDLSVDFVIDKSLSMGFGTGDKLRTAKRLTAALSYVVLSHLDRVRISAVSNQAFETLPEMRGKGGIFKVFRFLRPLEAQGGTDLRTALARVALLRRRRGTVVVLSDLYDPAGFEGAIQALLVHRVEILVVHMKDSEDCRPKAYGDVRVFDCETDESIDLSLPFPPARELEAAHRALFERAERFCKARNVAYLAADVALPFDDLMRLVFRTGMFRGTSAGG